jgi:hypothetical protein
MSFTFTPTILNRPLNPGEKLAYESKIERGKDYLFSKYQQAIDRVGLRGYDISGVQSAFDAIKPFVFVGDLDRNGVPEWQREVTSALNLALFGTERPNLAAQPVGKRQDWAALSSLVNQSASFHDVCDPSGDAKIEEVLLPAVAELIASL